eukprot:5602617-Alexandrium_andersonii.AAC.1
MSLVSASNSAGDMFCKVLSDDAGEGAGETEVPPGEGVVEDDAGLVDQVAVGAGEGAGTDEDL